MNLFTGLTEHIDIVNYCFTVLFIFLGLAAILKMLIYDKRHQPLKRAAMRESVYYIAFAVIGVVGLAVRLYKFGAVPAGIHYDEAMSAVDAKALADHGTDHYRMSLPVQMQAWKKAQQSALLAYITAPFVKIFGLTPLATRLPMLLLSIGAGVCFTLLIKDLFDKKTALIAAFLIAINPLYFLQSRWALDAYTMPHMFIISTYFLNRGFKNKKLLYLSMVLFGITMYSYTLSMFCVPLTLVLLALYMIVTKKANIRTILICAAIYTVVSLPVFVCMFINLIKADTIHLGPFTIPYFAESQRRGDMIFFVENPTAQLWNNIKEMYNALIRQSTSILCVTGFGTYFLFSVPLMLLGVFAVIRSKNKHAAAFLSAVTLGVIAIGLITPATVEWRLAIFVYTAAALCAVGLRFIFDELRAVGLAGIAAYCVAFVMLFASYHTSYVGFSHRLFFGGFGDALEYMSTVDADKYYITEESQFQNSKDVSEIYTLYYHEIDSEYFQGKTNIQDGIERLPYAERYIYGHILPENIKPDENAVYLVPDYEVQYFDTSKYDFRQFEGWQVNYTVVTKKQ